jgi:cytochrome c-type biogenesis protein CcsB
MILALLWKTTILVYMVSSVFFFSFIRWKKRGLMVAANILLMTGFVCHTAVIFWRIVELSRLPITDMSGSLSFFSWCVVGTFLLVQWRRPANAVGILVAPLAAILSVASGDPGTGTMTPEILQSPWLIVHGALAFCGEAVFASAFAAGVLYLIQERRIKKKRGGGFLAALPSLESLDEINYRCLSIGFPLLTAGIITGSLWASEAWGSYWSWDPKETFSLITWLVYAALLHQRLNMGWRGRRAAIFAIVGFGLVIFTFLGIHFWASGMHTFGAFEK